MANSIDITTCASLHPKEQGPGPVRACPYDSYRTYVPLLSNVCSSFKINNKIAGELHKPETHIIPTVVYKSIFNKKIYIYGNSYKTKDGSCVRDYVHIQDICSAIKKCLNYDE